MDYTIIRAKIKYYHFASSLLKINFIYNLRDYK
jgi:hypothetical protein